MGMHAGISYMMEALTYLGIKANHISFEQRMNKSVLSCANSEEAKHFAEASRLTYKRLDEALHPDETALHSLFGFFPGMPDGHPYGYNIANLVCSDAANQLLGYEEQKALIRRYNKKDLAKAALTSLGIFSNDMEDSFDFFNLIDKLSISQEDKFRIMTVCTNPDEYMDKVFEQLDEVVNALQSFEGEVMPFIEEYCARSAMKSITTKLNADIGFALPEDAKIEVIPYLLNPGIVAVMANDDNEYTVHIGMLYLSRFIGNPRLSDDEMLEMLKSISDPSRLEILRCLGGGEMYGREIAKQIGLYFTTVSHHMAKLMNCRLVRCRLAGNKAYYSIDEDGAKQFVNSICEMLKTKPD